MVTNGLKRPLKSDIYQVVCDLDHVRKPPESHSECGGQLTETGRELLERGSRIPTVSSVSRFRKAGLLDDGTSQLAGSPNLPGTRTVPTLPDRTHCRGRWVAESFVHRDRARRWLPCRGVNPRSGRDAMPGRGHRQGNAARRRADLPRQRRPPRMIRGLSVRHQRLVPASPFVIGFVHLRSESYRVTPGSIADVSHLDRITSDPEICHGKPTVRGLRYPVETLLELLASGMTTEEILEDYSDLERDDVLAALEFAALALGMRRAMPLGAA